jgi:hypothetical protein
MQEVYPSYLLVESKSGGLSKSLLDQKRIRTKELADIGYATDLRVASLFWNPT